MEAKSRGWSRGSLKQVDDCEDSGGIAVAYFEERIQATQMLTRCVVYRVRTQCLEFALAEEAIATATLRLLL